MQTPQVSNVSNALAAPAPGKQADANAQGESFGQVLSREVADRGNNAHAPKGSDTAQTNKQASTTQTKSVDGKKASDGKTAEDTAAESEASSTEVQVSADMLALVAALNRTSEPAPDAAVAKADAALATTDTATAFGLNGARAAGRTMSRNADAGAEMLADDMSKGKPELVPMAQDKSVLSADVVDAAAAVQETAQGKHGSTDFASTMKESLASLPASIGTMQHAAVQANQSASAHGAERLTPAVGTPGWDQALGQKVVWMVNGELQSASLTLNPPDLGPLQVVLSVSNSQATATFTAAQPEVRQALEAAMPRLRDMLGDAGIQLGQATVNSGAPGQQNAQDQQASQTHRGFDRIDSGADAPTRVGHVQPAVQGRGLVDTFV